MSAPLAWISRPLALGRSTDSIPRGVWIRLGVAYLLLGAGAWFLERTAGPEDWWLHGLWCCVGLAVALPTLSRMFRQGFALVLTEHRLTFLAAFSLYFLFGAALLALGPETEAEAVLRYYPIGAQEALRVNGINGLGFGLALLSSTLASGRWLGAQAARVAVQVNSAPAYAVIGLFLLLGTMTSLYVLWFDLGFRDGIVPGLVRSAGKLSFVAIFLAAAHRGRGENWLRALGAVLVLLLCIGGVLQFNKSEALLPLAAFVAGMSLRFGSLKMLPIGLALLVTGYLLLGNLTTYGRSAIGYQGAADFSERWQLLRDGWRDTRDLSEDQEYGTWARLCYTVPQAAALEFRDAGEGGDGLRLIPWVLVPRLVAPDKPEMTKTGREFNAKVTGSDTSSTGQGIFASGYYHGGWWGLALASLLCGWIVAQTSAIARAVFANHALLMLPLPLLGLFIAFRIDGDFVSDYIGTFIFILYPLLAASALMFVAGRTRRSPRLSR